jgi:hypothetical protein
MKITENQIQSRAVAGHTKDGEPVVYVVTKGGLHACFKRNKEGDVETLSAAPHKAIAKWLAEQKSPGLTWDDVDIEKAEADMFNKLRNMLFEKPTKPLPNPDGWQILYNPLQKKIELVTKSELHALVKSDESLKYAWFRDMSLEKSLQLVESISDLNLTNEKGS